MALLKNENNAKQFNKNSSNNKKKFNKPTAVKSQEAKSIIASKGKFNYQKKTNKDGTNAEPEKPNWTQFKKEKKDLKQKRKQGKDLFELTTRAKQIYEKLKCISTPNKDILVKELHSIIGSPANYQKLVFAHDTARIVQCILKYSSGDIRREISQNLLPIVAQMAISKYAHFCVLRMIKYGTQDIKEKVIEGLFGNIVKMVNYVHSSTIIDTVYISWANSQQKAYMRQEFYGDLYKNSKDSSVQCIADTYRESPHMKLGIVNSVKANLNHVANKKLIDNSVVHSVLLDYLKECSDDERNEMVTAYSPYIPSLASTKSGVRAAIICFWHSIVKDRRAIVKNLREHLIKLCTHEHGHVLVLAIINSMDDTKALKKAIFDLIFKEINHILSNEWGRKIIEWFVAPEDRMFFHPQITAFLAEGLKYSKKDKEIRRTEVFDAIEEPLCQSIIENPTFWLGDGHIGLSLAAVLKKVKNETLLKDVHSKLAAVICDPTWKVVQGKVKEKTEDDKAMAEVLKKINKKFTVDGDGKKSEPKENNEPIIGVEHPGLHIVLKKILKSDKEKAENNLPTFGAALAEAHTRETIKNWLKLNRASFLLLNAFENGVEETCNKLKTLIEQESKTLKKQTHAASKLINKKILNN